MKRILLFAAAMFLAVPALSGCTTLAGGSTAVADQTTADEKAAIAAEQAYKALVFFGNTALDFDLIKPEDAPKIAAIDNKVFQSLETARALYRAGNASTLAGVKREAELAIIEIANLIKGD